jgi:L-rhamnose mutarotase
VKVALHTRLRADRITEYEQAHAAVPEELTQAIRAAGVTAWTIWRSGTDLFHLVDCADYAAALAYLDRHPVNATWQARMKPLLETVHDYSAAGEGAALPVVWQL